MNERDEIWLVSNAHIDLSWLWTKEETIHEICPMTFSSVLRLMKKYPFLIYAQSAAQIYIWMEKYYPEIYENIKKRISEGRWEVVGGSWVEHNANLPCGESLVRQYLYGKRYFKEKFRVDVKVGWLPDVFGFCWTLPQIFKKSGIDFFVTHKLKWQIERMKPPIPFPYYIFWWEAPDGSRVLAYHTVGGYGERIERNRMLRQLEELKKKHSVNLLLVLFGRGDHGGGPTEDMIENALNLMRDPNYPKIRFVRAQDYFEKLLEISRREKFPTVRDELYVKTHRGTYTTEAFVKKNNRLCEVLLISSEVLSSIAMRYGMKYPSQELYESWLRLLFNQVHDNLDGTSIAEVYEAAAKDYNKIKETTKRIIQRALEKICENIDTTGEGISLIVFNILSWPRTSIVEVDLDELGISAEFSIIDASTNEAIPYQIVHEMGKKKILFLVKDVPPVGYKEYKVIEGTREQLSPTDLKVGEYFLENEFYRVEVNPNTGLVKRIYDKRHRREVLDSSGRGNVIQLFEDRPPNAPAGEPAWNMYLGDFIEITNLESLEVVERGPVRGLIRIVRRYGNSKFIQEVILYSGLQRVDFRILVDWHEKYKTAKIAFPLSFTNDYATYEIPFGAIQRYQYVLEGPPKNKMYMPAREWEEADKAKFEVPALRWVDVTDERKEYGVALLNDGRYGFDFKENLLRMTLLRGARRGYPRTPESWTDQSNTPYVGIHELRYAIYAHKGDWRDGWVTNRGYEFNFPLIVHIEKRTHKGTLPKAHSFVRIKPDNIILTTLKKSEDDQALVLRMYEAHSKDCEAVVTFDIPVASVSITDLVEWGKYVTPKELSVNGNSVKLKVQHNEIVTLKVHLK